MTIPTRYYRQIGGGRFLCFMFSKQGVSALIQSNDPVKTCNVEYNPQTSRIEYETSYAIESSDYTDWRLPTENEIIKFGDTIQYGIYPDSKVLENISSWVFTGTGDAMYVKQVNFRTARVAHFPIVYDGKLIVVRTTRVI